MKRYRKVAHANLQRAFGDEWDERRRTETVRACFGHIGTTLMEFLWMPRLQGEAIDQRIGVEGQEHFEAAFARGKGVILVTAHFGNWEIMGPKLIRHGYKLNIISRDADDPGINQLINGIRQQAGEVIVGRKNSARPSLQALKRNEMLAILLDQNTWQGGIFVPFFGHPASTATGPAVLGLRSGAALVPVFCIRQPDRSHVIKVWPYIIPEPTGDQEGDVYRLTAELTRVIEMQIREVPDQWMWIHNRWKRQPGDEYPGKKK